MRPQPHDGCNLKLVSPRAGSVRATQASEIVVHGAQKKLKRAEGAHKFGFPFPPEVELNPVVLIHAHHKQAKNLDVYARLVEEGSPRSPHRVSCTKANRQRALFTPRRGRNCLASRAATLAAFAQQQTGASRPLCATTAALTRSRCPFLRGGRRFRHLSFSALFAPWSPPAVAHVTGGAGH
jgi:hypothetical protein